MFNNSIVCFLFVSLTLGISSCNQKENAPIESEPLTEIPSIEDEKEINAEEVISKMPSPIEMAILIKGTGANYNMKMLNPVQNLSKYVSNNSKALNLGIYCADVGYTSLFKQTQETMLYLECCRKLSDDIGLTDAFDKSIFKRVENNIDRRDSLLEIMSGNYKTAFNYLKDNKQFDQSLLIIGGSWIESMYLTTQLCKTDNPPADIVERIAQQEISLRKMVKSMESIENESVQILQAKFADLLTLLSKQKLTTKRNDQIHVNKSHLKAVIEKVETIRNGIIKV